MGFRYNHPQVVVLSKQKYIKKNDTKTHKVIRRRDTAVRRHQLSKRDLLFLKSLGLKIRKSRYDGNK
jgi:hypothetical protein